LLEKSKNREKVKIKKESERKMIEERIERVRKERLLGKEVREAYGMAKIEGVQSSLKLENELRKGRILLN
jgi:hypothetical protein